MPILDRVPSKPDPIRQTRYAMTSLVAGLTPRSYTWKVPFILDQGEEGACVAHGIVHEAIARPVIVDFTKHELPAWAVGAGMAGHSWPRTSERIAQAFAFDLYDWCQRNDEWVGEDYAGTSAAAGAKGAVASGLWAEYRWTSDVDEFAVWVSRNGPGVIAVDWYGGMFQPDSDGYLHVKGGNQGGHMILVNGYNVRRRAFRLTNSWGSAWGQGGAAWLRADDLARLVDIGGELLGPVRRLA